MEDLGINGFTIVFFLVTWHLAETGNDEVADNLMNIMTGTEERIRTLEWKGRLGSLSHHPQATLPPHSLTSDISFGVCNRKVCFCN